MNHIGSYDGYKVYQLDWHEQPLNKDGVIYVDGNGNMYYKGVIVGKLDPRTYSVKSYNMSLYHKHAAQEAKRAAMEAKYTAEKDVYMSRAKKEAAKKTEKEVPVPACVAECTATTAAVGKDLDLCGTDEFFARVAKDIDDILASAREKIEVDIWEFE